MFLQNENNLFTSLLQNKTTKVSRDLVLVLYIDNMPRRVKGGVKETNADGVIYTDSAYSNSAEKRAHYVNHHMKGKQPSQLADDRETAERLGLTEPGWFVHAWSDTRGIISYAILGPDNAVYTNKTKAISAHNRAAEIYLQCQRKVSGNRICGAIKKAYDNSMPSCDTCGGGQARVTTKKAWKIVSKESITDTSSVTVSAHHLFFIICVVSSFLNITHHL